MAQSIELKALKHENQKIPINHTAGFTTENFKKKQKVTEYQVYGTVINPLVNTVLEFEKAFCKKKAARKYFKKMKLQYPISEIVFVKNTRCDIALYV